MMQDWLRARAYATPKQTALIIGSDEWTYGTLDQLVDNLCGWLSAAGVEREQRVAVLMSSGIEYVCLVHALARLGTTLVPLNTRLTTHELRWQLEHVGTDTLIYSRQMAARAASLTEASRQQLLFDEQHLISSHPTNVSPATFHFDQPQAIVFTSGTTGHPKGVTLTFGNHFWSATASAFRLGLVPHDCWLSCLPMYHVGGLAIIWRSCLYGTTVVLHQGFNLDAVNHSLETKQITLISLVPTMLYRMLQQGTNWPSSLRLILLGGAAASKELIDASHAQNLPVATTYGLTEASSQVATMLPEDVYHKPGSVGRPLLFTSVRIADENGHTLPPNQWGEVVVSGKTVMHSYYRNPDATHNTLRHGELYTGDIGYLDEDGDLWLVQRRRDIIISGGENIYPAEVETLLRTHPAIADSCIVGIPHPEWGQQVAAMITLKDNQTLTVEELLTFSRQHLAGYKQPRHVVFVDALPQTASGKIHRRGVEEMLKERDL